MFSSRRQVFCSTGTISSFNDGVDCACFPFFSDPVLGMWVNIFVLLPSMNIHQGLSVIERPLGLECHQDSTSMVARSIDLA
ncbi:hypothetical protein CO705_18220 [Ralstonia pickettii]|nr:hypothetical protein CO705_18220 [Ralstonia pickettii]